MVVDEDSGSLLGEVPWVSRAAWNGGWRQGQWALDSPHSGNDQSVASLFDLKTFKALGPDPGR